MTRIKRQAKVMVHTYYSILSEIHITRSIHSSDQKGKLGSDKLDILSNDAVPSRRYVLGFVKPYNVDMRDSSPMGVLSSRGYNLH